MIVAVSALKELYGAVEMDVGMGKESLTEMLLSQYSDDGAVFLCGKYLLLAAAHRYEPVRPEAVDALTAHFLYDLRQLLVVAS